VNSETKNKNNAILQSFGWGYDSLDLKSFEKRIHNGGKGDAFSYDALKRLTNVTFDSPTPETPTATGVKSRAITLDKLDNILKITDNVNAMVTEIIGELEGKGKALNQYSKFNDLPLEYDTNGNLFAKGSRLFVYDYRNRLIRSSRGDDAVTFTYDIFGRQTSRTDLSGTYHFFYAGDQKIEERNGANALTRQYIWGNGIDELLRLDIYNGSSSTPYYVHADAIGSTTAITDSSGNLVERVTYDSYGVPTFTDALGQTLKKSTIRNTTLFQGREYDYDLALYNYRARYYDPIMGRFLQTDPLGYQDSMNLYQGMNMNPFNFVDPMGKYFVVPEGPYKQRILGCLALGALTDSGRPLFETILNDPRPVSIVDSNLPVVNLPDGKISITRGRIDPPQVGKEKNRVISVPVEIGFSNLENYHALTGFDKSGLSTIYHELFHANAYLSSAPWNDVSFITAHQTAWRQDQTQVGSNSQSNGTIYAEAGSFGQKVYQESQTINLTSPATLIKIQHTIKRIEQMELFFKEQEKALQELEEKMKKDSENYFNNLTVDNLLNNE